MASAAFEVSNLEPETFPVSPWFHGVRTLDSGFVTRLALLHGRNRGWLAPARKNPCRYLLDTKERGGQRSQSHFLGDGIWRGRGGDLCQHEQPFPRPIQGDGPLRWWVPVGPQPSPCHRWGTALRCGASDSCPHGNGRGALRLRGCVRLERISVFQVPSRCVGTEGLTGGQSLLSL